MSDDSTFLRGLLANPQDNDLRRIYADWLEECGDARAPFLRLEVALHESQPGASALDLRERMHQTRGSLDRRWVTLVERPRVGWRLVRTKTSPRTYGKALPAFIHNGSYHLTTVDVFPDGAINCWGYVDLALFRGRLAQGWVVPRAEVGGMLGIYNLGLAPVIAAQWDYMPADVESQVMDALREMNPTLEGLIDMQGTDTEVRNGMRYNKLYDTGTGTLYRPALTGDEILGQELPVFEVTTDGLRLRRWFLYADGLSQLGYETELMPVEAVARMFDEGRLTLSVPAGAWVRLDGLGRFQAGEGHWNIKPGERIREAFGLVEQLNGGPGAFLRCLEAFKAHKANPGRERREELRRAYEAIPEHLRRYGGKRIPRILADESD